MKKHLRSFLKTLTILGIPTLIIWKWYSIPNLVKLPMMGFLYVYFIIAMYYITNSILRSAESSKEAQIRYEQSTLEEKIQEIYDKERKGYYQDAVFIFNQLMKAGKLKRPDILKFKSIINSCLGNYSDKYD